MTPLVCDAADQHDTDRLGRLLAATIPAGTTVALCGTLGAGKTRLVQAIAAGLSIDRDEVVSPTFVLVQQYHGAKTLNHLDAYRLRDEDEFRELGIEEMFASDGITVVEWADRIEQALPDDYLRIDIEVTGETSRRFRIRAVGSGWDAALVALRDLLIAGAHEASNHQSHE
jgi:tRNA threonylcarbamoyladenosine biosynthesis protein TsaE